jgi:hypothetical protein
MVQCASLIAPYVLNAVIPGRCAAPNPESRSFFQEGLDSGFALTRAPE